jgi:tRNA (uracil-5-)-methyltransferase
MKFGDRLQGNIEDVDDKGRGRYNVERPGSPEKSVVIPFAFPGDVVDAAFIKRDKGEWIGKIDTITKASADRVDAPCPHAGVCGGCLWQQLSYDAQLKLKLDMINRAFTKAGHTERVANVTPSAEQFYFRNRMDYAIGWKNEIGLKEYGSWNRYIDIKECLLLDKESPKILEIVRELMQELHLKPWDAKHETGDMRYVVIRLGKNTNERLVMLVVKDLNAISETARQRISEALSPLSTSLLIGENPLITDLSYVTSVACLKGNPFHFEEVNGVRYKIHPNSFFQTNTDMAGVLQNAVLAHVSAVKPKHVLDLYCGLGFFAIALAKQGVSSYGHEIDAAAIELAKENAALNDVAELTDFGAGPVEDFDWSHEQPDVVILDPPRAGLHPRALNMVLDQKPEHVVYVSCNYHRLMQELTKFKGVYDVQSVQAFDLFPHTPHVELVVKLKKK